MTTPQSVSHSDALDIVFANRNRAYGAYQLRRQYPAALGHSLAIGLLLIGFFLVLPRILSAVTDLMPEKSKSEDGIKFTEIYVEPPPPPPVLETPPPPTRAAQRFVPPVVEEDKNVPEEPPKQGVDDLLNDPAEIGSVTIEGPTDGPPSLGETGLQTGILESVVVEDNDIYEAYGVQKPPSFPGGEADLMRYLANNIQYPAVARENNIQGPVVLTFVIGKDGSIQDVAILRDIGGGCGKEAVRVVKTMPRWSPGEANGHPVKVRHTLPVRFQLQ